MEMANSQIFELTRVGTIANPRIGAQWVTGLTPGLSPNTAHETLVDQAGNSVEINLLPPVHFYTFPHKVLTHGLTRLLVINRTAWKDTQDTRSGTTATASSRPTHNQREQTHGGQRDDNARSSNRSSDRRSRSRSRNRGNRDRNDSREAGLEKPSSIPASRSGSVYLARTSSSHSWLVSR